jgi:uncharacterized membrane protein
MGGIMANDDGMKSNRVLRAMAREQLHGVWSKMAFAFFVAFLFYTPLYAVTFLEQRFAGEGTISVAYVVVSIMSIAISGPFYLGFAGYFLKRIRQERIGTKNIFDGFKHFSRGFCLGTAMSFFTFLWTLLLLIPGIVKSLSYGMAFFILADNPDMKARQALQESCRIMKGRRWQLFRLYFSFTGWALLGIFTLGIGYFWLSPYIYMGIANFYESLKGGEKNIPEPALEP